MTLYCSGWVGKRFVQNEGLKEKREGRAPFWRDHTRHQTPVMSGRFKVGTVLCVGTVQGVQLARFWQFRDVISLFQARCPFWLV